MIKNHKFFSLFAITLVAALLLSMSGKATSVYALADPVQAVSPIYDTQIYQLQDYIEHGGMTSGQLDIFYTLAGFYVLGQAGSTGYRLVDPYSNTDSVWEWLKSCGIELYNTVIGLIPDTAQMPITGDIYSTIPFKKASQLYVATLMGAAVKAATFASYQDFKDEVENSESYWLPWNLDVQKGMNSIFGIYNGIYEWQFDSVPFTTSVTYNKRTMTSVQQSQWNNYYNSAVKPVRINPYYSNTSDSFFDLGQFTQYHNLYFNTDTNSAIICNDAGLQPSGRIYTSAVFFNSSNQIFKNDNWEITYLLEYRKTFNLQNYNSYQEGVTAFYNSAYYQPGYYDSGYTFVFLEDFIDHVYIGSNWLNKTEIFNLSDLNFDNSDQQYYTAVPDTNDYLIDIKGILQDILNNTDLFNVFINNLVDINGVPVHDDDLIRITTNIYDLLEQTNPIMPVNLNDISDYTSNDYLDLVKQHGQNFGQTIGEYVAFWHNSDPEITYVIFGALILTLIGAFVGKWGHS